MSTQDVVAPAVDSTAAGECTPPAEECAAAAGSSCGDGALMSQFGWTVTTLFKGLTAASERAVAQVPGRLRGYHVLTLAAHAPARNQLLLSQELGIDRTVMTYLLDDLQKAGLITRQPDPGDRRARHIVTTQAGLDLLERLRGRLAEAEAQVLAPLHPNEQEQFRATLVSLATHVRSLPAPCDGSAPPPC